MDELQLVYSMVSEAHKRAQVPITAKIRVFDDDAKTLQYAKCLQVGPSRHTFAALQLFRSSMLAARLNLTSCVDSCPGCGFDQLC